jgi:exo-beta-1,3-glucanase (GH17 family)
MAAYKAITVFDSTDNLIRRSATVEIRRYLRGRTAHITVTTRSGWPTDGPVAVKRTSSRCEAKEIVRNFLR